MLGRLKLQRQACREGEVAQKGSTTIKVECSGDFRWTPRIFPKISSELGNRHKSLRKHRGLRSFREGDYTE